MRRVARALHVLFHSAAAYSARDQNSQTTGEGVAGSVRNADTINEM